MKEGLTFIAGIIERLASSRPMSLLYKCLVPLAVGAEFLLELLASKTRKPPNNGCDHRGGYPPH